MLIYEIHHRDFLDKMTKKIYARSQVNKMYSGCERSLVTCHIYWNVLSIYICSPMEYKPFNFNRNTSPFCPFLGFLLTIALYSVFAPKKVDLVAEW